MPPITFYTAKGCPYAQRVEIAFAEAKANYRTYQINLASKPDWYAPKVNRQGKVPAIAYGGPDVPPENPSPESVKLSESLVLVEFVADLFPESSLLPKDPVGRAQARFFVEMVTSKFHQGFNKFFLLGGGSDDLIAGAEAIQNILPASGRYAIGDEYTIADVAISPFIARLRLLAQSELGNFPLGQGSEVLKTLSTEKYAKFNAYADRILERPSVQATFDAEHLKGLFAKRFSRA